MYTGKSKFFTYDYEKNIPKCITYLFHQGTSWGDCRKDDDIRLEGPMFVVEASK